MSEFLDQARKLAEIHYKSGSTTHVYLAYGQDNGGGAEESIKLIEVNEDTIPSGVVPLQFGPMPELGITHCTTIVEVTPDEFRRIELGDLALPEGWEHRQLIERSDESAIARK